MSENFTAEDILHEITLTRRRLLDNDQPVLCAALFDLQLTAEEQTRQLRKIRADKTAAAIIAKFVNPRLASWMNL